MNSTAEFLWDIAKEEIIERALLSVGLSALNPWGKAASFLIGKFLDKFVKPQYHLSVAQGVKKWAEVEGKRKLKEMDDAIASNDRGKVIDIIDSLD